MLDAFWIYYALLRYVLQGKGSEMVKFRLCDILGNNEEFEAKVSHVHHFCYCFKYLKGSLNIYRKNYVLHWIQDLFCIIYHMVISEVDLTC